MSLCQAEYPAHIPLGSGSCAASIEINNFGESVTILGPAVFKNCKRLRRGIPLLGMGGRGNDGEGVMKHTHTQESYYERHDTDSTRTQASHTKHKLQSNNMLLEEIEKLLGFGVPGECVDLQSLGLYSLV